VPRRVCADPLLPVPGASGSCGGADPSDDAAAARRLLNRPSRPGRADLLGAEQPSALFRAHAAVVERAATNMSRIRDDAWKIPRGR
jgi:hypothetical protein